MSRITVLILKIKIRKFMNDIKCKFQKLRQLNVTLSQSLRYLTLLLADVLVYRYFCLGPNLDTKFAQIVIIEHQANFRDKKVFNLSIRSHPHLQSNDHTPKAQLRKQMDHLSSPHLRGLFGTAIHVG